MITFFTTAKDFKGKTKTAQKNAIRSWKNSIQEAEIILFSKSEGAEEISEELEIKYIPDIRVSDQGTPFISEMFEIAGDVAKYEVCCFINADIIIYPVFSKSLLEINNLLKANYLVVGQRKDLDFDQEIDFDTDWETILEKTVRQKASIHLPTGSDFFAFPKGQYKVGDIPDLLVGRQGWDLWMIYNARCNKAKAIDLSRKTMVIHQNHDYSHRRIKVENLTIEEEALSNYKHLPFDETYIYTLLACNFYYQGGKLKRNFARGDLRRFITYELSLRKKQPGVKLLKKLLTKIRLAH